jgi:hypothetical protein
MAPKIAIMLFGGLLLTLLLGLGLTEAHAGCVAQRALAAYNFATNAPGEAKRIARSVFFFRGPQAHDGRSMRRV